ncbi:hypothetical protein [Paenibacillus sp. FSL H7-0756]
MVVDAYGAANTLNIKMIGNAFGYNGPEAKGRWNRLSGWFR